MPPTTFKLKVTGGRLDDNGCVKINDKWERYVFEDAKMEYNSEFQVLSFTTPYCSFKVILDGIEAVEGQGTPFNMEYKGDPNTVYLRYWTWNGPDQPFWLRFDMVSEPPFWIEIEGKPKGKPKKAAEEE